MKTLFSLFLVLAVLLSMVVACQPKQPQVTQATEVPTQKPAAAEPEGLVQPTPAGPVEPDVTGEVTLTMWVPYQDRLDEYQILMSEFNKIYPNIHIQMEVQPDIWTKTPLALNNRTEPDILNFMTVMARPWIAAGVFEPVPDWVMTKEQIESTFYAETLKSFEWEGQYYGLPIETTMGNGLVVNLTLLKESGVEFPKEWLDTGHVDDWDRLIEIAKQATKFDEQGNVIQAGLAVHGGHVMYDVLAWAVQCGGDYRDEANRRVNFNTPGMHKAVQFLVDLVQVHKVDDPALPDKNALFIAKQAAMVLNGPWVVGLRNYYARSWKGAGEEMPDIRWLTTPPLCGDKFFWPIQGAWTFLISRNGKNPNAAWKWVNFWFESELAHDLWIGGTGHGAARPAYVTEAYYRKTGNTHILSMLPIQGYGFDAGSYVLDNWALFWTVTLPELEAVLAGNKSIDQALTAMTDGMNRVIEEQYSKIGR